MGSNEKREGESDELVSEGPLPVDDSSAETYILAAHQTPPSLNPEQAMGSGKGRYRIIRKHDDGGMAVVYEARDTNLDRVVALKVLREELGGSSENRKRFYHEARILGEMDHPGIVPVYERGELAPGGHAYAMKLVRGRTFRKILDGRGKKQIRDEAAMAGFISIYDKICQTVAYAHKRGIIHRDLKPSNIMVDEYGVVMVLDWGLSKKMADGIRDDLAMTQTGVVMGTPSYMSPEQARGHVDEIDFRSDVFSLGIILYEILTGAFPFEGRSRTEVLRKIQEMPPVNPRKKNRTADRVLTAICMKSLHKDPALRYRTAGELSSDIHNYRNHLRTSAYTPGLRDRIGNWASRHPVRATAAVMLSVMIFLGASVIGTSLEMQQLFRDNARELAIDYTDRITSEVNDFDSRISELKSELAEETGQEAAAREKAESEILKLEAVREIYFDFMQRIIVGLMFLTMKEAHPGLSGMNPELLARVRTLYLEDAEHLLERGEYYKAHMRVWYALVHPDRLGWTEAERSRLLTLNGRLESAIRQGKGPDFEMPSWEGYDPMQIFVTMMQNTMVDLPFFRQFYAKTEHHP